MSQKCHTQNHFQPLEYIDINNINWEIKVKSANINYLEKAKKLEVEEQERLMSRMAGKLPKRLQKEKLTKEEAIAIQLELEDEQLHEWRGMMEELKAKSQKAQMKAAEKVAAQQEKLAKKAALDSAKMAKKNAVAEAKLAKKTMTNNTQSKKQTSIEVSKTKAPLSNDVPKKTVATVAPKNAVNKSEPL